MNSVAYFREINLSLKLLVHIAFLFCSNLVCYLDRGTMESISITCHVRAPPRNVHEALKAAQGLSQTMVGGAVGAAKELTSGLLTDYRVRNEYDGVDGGVSAIVTTLFRSKHSSQHLLTQR